MGRVWGSNSLRCEVTSNIQISWILPFFDDLVMRSCLSDCVLLRFNVLAECAVFAFEFRSHSLDRFLDGGQVSISRLQFLLRTLTGVRTTKPCPNELRAFIGQTRPARA